MRSFRTNKLLGTPDNICNHCYQEDSVGKLSGRRRQLLKSVITLEDFDKSLCASPHWSLFENSLNNEGFTWTMPIDLQVDLGNTCNSSCIMCNPTYSSKLATDYQKLHLMSEKLFPQYAPVTNWADDPILLTKFIDDLTVIPDIKYIHFLGGETLYLKSFYEICRALINAGSSKNIIIGTTTNATVFSQELVDIIKEFKQFHLGISIETIDSLNDYIRYPSKITEILSTIDRFLELRTFSGLQISLRITPNIFTIYRIDKIFEYMIENSIIAESCNILTSPECLRIELLPDDIKQDIIDRILKLIETYDIKPNNMIINRRRQDLVDPVISNVIYEYLGLLTNLTAPIDVEEQRYDLIKFIKSFEELRSNCILDHLPEYEEFLRSYGY
jgi:hypothetical protein